MNTILKCISKIIAILFFLIVQGCYPLKNDEKLFVNSKETSLTTIVQSNNASTNKPSITDKKTKAGFLKGRAIMNARTPYNEQYRGDWRFEIHAIDEQCHRAGPSYFVSAKMDGSFELQLPQELKEQPLVVYAYNQTAPLRRVPMTPGQLADLEIFIPRNCFDKNEWNISPYGDIVWSYYKRACKHSAEAWNPHLVDCALWGKNLKNLYLTSEISSIVQSALRLPLRRQVELFYQALRRNQSMLLPTRTPLCLAEERHNGGSMERGERILPVPSISIDEATWPTYQNGITDSDPITINLASGLPSSLCGVALSQNQQLSFNQTIFIPNDNYYLDDPDFMGTIHDVHDNQSNLDVSLYNVKLGNGRDFSNDKYDDACALTNIIKFKNNDDDEQDITTTSGVTFFDLFANKPTQIYKTSDGDAVVDKLDTWAIFYTVNADLTKTVLAVELLGHRKEDLRDVLAMDFDSATENLFLGLRENFELNEEYTDGEEAFALYTLHVWDESSPSAHQAISKNIANCYEAADPWTRQYFTPSHFLSLSFECDHENSCCAPDLLPALEAAEFAVQSQCFSSSRANQRFRTLNSGLWSMNNDRGVASNIVINPGWLGPELTMEIYLQKFDEAVVRGPLTLAKTDITGQLLATIPTVVEGDRVLIKAQDSCCQDYALTIPCVPTFTGFSLLQSAKPSYPLQDKAKPSP